MDSYLCLSILLYTPAQGIVIMTYNNLIRGNWKTNLHKIFAYFSLHHMRHHSILTDKTLPHTLQSSFSYLKFIQHNQSQLIFHIITCLWCILGTNRSKSDFKACWWSFLQCFNGSWDPIIWFVSGLSLLTNTYRVECIVKL